MIRVGRPGIANNYLEPDHIRGTPVREDGQGRPFALATAALIACASGLTAVPATSTVGVELTPMSMARAVTYGGQSR